MGSHASMGGGKTGGRDKVPVSKGRERPAIKTPWGRLKTGSIQSPKTYLGQSREEGENHVSCGIAGWWGLTVFRTLQKNKSTKGTEHRGLIR